MKWYSYSATRYSYSYSKPLNPNGSFRVAQEPDLSDEQIDQELDRQRAIKRQIDEQGLYKLYVEEKPRGKN